MALRPEAVQVTLFLAVVLTAVFLTVLTATCFLTGAATAVVVLAPAMVKSKEKTATTIKFFMNILLTIF